MSAVSVGAPVGAGPEELVEQVAVAGVHLDAGRADLLRDTGAAHERALDLLQLPARRGTPPQYVRVLEPGRAERRVRGERPVPALRAARTLVEELDEHVPARRADPLYAVGPGVAGGLGDPPVMRHLGGRRVVDGAGLGDHECAAAEDSAPVVLDELGHRLTVRAPLALHRGQDETVGQRHSADRDRREHGGEVEVPVVVTERDGAGVAARRAHGRPAAISAIRARPATS